MLGIVLGIVFGAVGAWWFSQRAFKIQATELEAKKTELTQAQMKIQNLEVRWESDVKAYEEKMELLRKAQIELKESFKSLSSDALKSNNESFLQLAKAQLSQFHEMAKGDLHKKQDVFSEMVKPVKESLERFDSKIHQMEKSRVEMESALLQQVKTLTQTQSELKTETNNLVSALRAPQGRGQWGEMQLKRVVEMAGMLEYCDFVVQESAQVEDGRIRPDLIVKLPGGKNIVVDAKASLLAYLDAIQQTSFEARRDKMIEHARQVRKQVDLLSKKSYWDQFRPAPEFVVLFIPGESFFSAALEQDPSLIEAGVTQNVIIATPTTLIALLRSVAYGWRQEKLADNARMIGDLGRELYKRISDMSSHFGRLGKSLQGSVESYNKTMATLESRVMVSARKFKELSSDVAGVDMIELEPIEVAPRLPLEEVPLLEEPKGEA